MVKIYLAAKIEQQVWMRSLRDRLVALGFEVTSQWIDVEKTEDSSVPSTDEERTGHAMMDCNDVIRSDVVLTFSQERRVPAIGGGRHVEFGIALCHDKLIMVVGPKGEHIFHYMPGVQHHATVEEAIGWLIVERDRLRGSW